MTQDTNNTAKIVIYTKKITNTIVVIILFVLYIPLLTLLVPVALIRSLYFSLKFVWTLTFGYGNMDFLLENSIKVCGYIDSIIEKILLKKS